MRNIRIYIYMYIRYGSILFVGCLSEGYHSFHFLSVLRLDLFYVLARTIGLLFRVNWWRVLSLWDAVRIHL